ncbi:MAG: RNA polymerase sigma factor [Acidimicrobiales bacterium]
MTGPGWEPDDLGGVLARLLPAGWDGPIAARDQVALDAAVRRAWTVVYHRARARVVDPAEAEEVAQEVFCRVLLRLGATPGTDLEVRAGYLRRAASNLLADRWRARARHRDADRRVAESRPAEPAPPDERLVVAEEHETLRRALARLPPVQRQVLRLRIVEELSAEETAAVVGKSAAAVRQIQHRALKTLRSHLAADPT